MKHEIWQFGSDHSGYNISEAIERILLELHKLKNSSSNNKIISLNFFIASDNDDFYKQRKIIIAKLRETFNIPPAFSVIAQIPAATNNVQVDVNVINAEPGEISVQYKMLENEASCTILDTNSYTEYYLSGFTIADESDSINDKISGAYERMQKAIQSLDIGMNNIVRQWNYLEGIVIQEKTGQGNSQHYQMLNDTRHLYYSKYSFNKGYPAATGIGMHTGGCVIDCVAMKEKEDSFIVPIKNPRQVSAYEYSRKVLIGSESQPLTTPKFERAKLFRRCIGNYELLISGTAAILDEKSLGINDAREQSKITLENIDTLVESASRKIEDAGEKVKNVTLSYLRVYIKRKEDFSAVKKICDAYGGAQLPVYLIADICREELLVEIEGYYSIITS
jgi:enamine deaminase RidA (YjgF/YER057c/UK114 family)